MMGNENKLIMPKYYGLSDNVLAVWGSQESISSFLGCMDGRYIIEHFFTSSKALYTGCGTSLMLTRLRERFNVAATFQRITVDQWCLRGEFVEAELSQLLALLSVAPCSWHQHN